MYTIIGSVLKNKALTTIKHTFLFSDQVELFRIYRRWRKFVRTVRLHKDRSIFQHYYSSNLKAKG